MVSQAGAAPASVDLYGRKPGGASRAAPGGALGRLSMVRAVARRCGA